MEKLFRDQNKETLKRNETKEWPSTQINLSVWSSSLNFMLVTSFLFFSFSSCSR
jgi:hypothetical protein